jgi:hypothetical protein
MEGKKKLGLPSVVATGVGVIVATSCLLSVGHFLRDRFKFCVNAKN